MNRQPNCSRTPLLLLACSLALLLAAVAVQRSHTAAADDPGAPKPKPAARPDAGKTDESEEKDADDVTNPLGANAACYVCHIPFVREEISKVHLAAKVGCIKCHGLSADHANDEDIGATKPDIVFKHDQVDKMCSECHQEHDAPAREVVARFIQRKLTAETTACTDCHGTHKIEESAEEEEAEGKAGGG